MPLPLFIALGVGAVSAIHGGMKMKEANDTLEMSKRRHEDNIERFEEKNKETNEVLDILGKTELEILNSFETFSDTIEKIQNRPEFKEFHKDGITLPQYDLESLKEVSVGAGVILGALEGAVAGVAAGYAVEGVAQIASKVLKTEVSAVAASTLTGAIATNATLAAIGGGTLAAGGAGMAAGALSVGVAPLVGGVVFNIAGSRMQDKADEVYYQMLKAEEKVNKICRYLDRLKATSVKYTNSLQEVRTKYIECFDKVCNTVDVQKKTDWNLFSETEKREVQNTVLLVGLLYKMCKVNLVNKATGEGEMNTINHKGVDGAINDARHILDEQKIQG